MSFPAACPNRCKVTLIAFLCCLPYACSYSFSMFQKHYSFWGPSSDDDDYDVNIRAQRQADEDYDGDDDCNVDDYNVNIRAQRQAAPPNAGFRL